jgi:hypothetical protein
MTWRNVAVVNLPDRCIIDNFDYPVVNKLFSQKVLVSMNNFAIFTIYNKMKKD